MENTKENSNMGKDALEELGFSKSHDNKSDVWKKGKKRKRIITRNQKSEWFVMLETYSVGNLEWFCDSFKNEEILAIASIINHGESIYEKRRCN